MLTYAVALALAVVPGAVLGFALPAGRYRWSVFVASPAVTLGLTAAAMGWLPVLGLRNGPLDVLAAAVALAVLFGPGTRLGTAWQRRRARHAHPDAAPAPRTRRPRSVLARLGLPQLADLVGVTVPAVITVGFGRLFLGGLAQPPGWDAMNHGFLTRRMMQTGSTAVQDVCVTGSTHVALSCSFYPLSADTLWAQTAVLTNGRVSTAMLAWAMLVGPLAMVAGVFATVRLLGGGTVVAAATATLPAMIGPLWFSLTTGRVTDQAAPAMAAGVAVLVALVLRGRHPVATGAAAGLAGLGIVMSHTYDVLFIGTLAILVSLWLPRGRWTVRRTPLGLASAGLVGLAGVAPFLSALLGANAERDASTPKFDSLRESLQFWVTDLDRYTLFGFPPPWWSSSSLLSVESIRTAFVVTLVAICASPLSFVVRPLRWARPWIAVGVLWTGIAVWTSYSTQPVAVALASLWYSRGEQRIWVMIMPVYPVAALAGACAIGVIAWRLAGWVAAPVRRVAKGVEYASATGAVALVVLLTIQAVQPSSWEPLQADVHRRAPVGAEYQRTYRWLAKHTPPGTTVAYDRHGEYLTWSYADYGTDLLFGIPPLVPKSLPNYRERRLAYRWLINHKKPRPAGCLVRKYDIRYLAFGERRVPGWPRSYDPAKLFSTDRIRLVHQDGDLRVFEVTDAGRACP